MKLKFYVSLTKGDVADNVEVVFLVPPGFSFPGRTLTLQDADHPITPSFATTLVGYAAPIKSGLNLSLELVLKTPSKSRTYEAYYRIVCRGFSGKYEKFEIIVE